MFALQNAPAEQRWSCPGSTLRGPCRVDVAVTAKFDLTLALAEAGERLGGHAGVRHRRCSSAATVERLAGPPAGGCCEAMAADPSGGCRALPLLTAAERAQVLVEWNATAAAYPRERVRPRAVRGAGGAHAGRGRRWSSRASG